MATRAYPHNETLPPAGAEEWQALRAELLALLDQVEGQYVRAPQPVDSGQRALSERMRDLRAQVSNVEPDLRHKEALRSVKRAVDRFSDRDEPSATGRETLDAAITDIRNRQTARPVSVVPPTEAPRAEAVRAEAPPVRQAAVREDKKMPAPEPVAPPAPEPVRTTAPQPEQVFKVEPATPAPVRAEAPAPAKPEVARSEPVRAAEPPRAEAPRIDLTPKFDELGKSVGGISSRLERLEGELKSQRLTQVNIKDIADQVTQVSHVVELLADAVGETGQVKKLEGQIAGLATLITSGHEVDISTLTQRLDDVSSTVERLADLQIQHVTLEKETPAQQAALRSGMHTIENGVRAVYDRIDAIEKKYALSPADFDRLTSEMAKFTGAMQEAVQPHGLLELVDALNTRIADIETRDSDVSGLKSDIEALRASVIEAVAPRMAAIEVQLDAMNDRDSAVKAVEPRLVAIQDQLEAMSDRSALIETVEPRVRAIQSQIEAIGDRSAMIESVEPRVRAIQSQLEVINDRGAMIEAVEPRMRSIQNHLEMLNDRGASIEAVEPRMMAIQDQLEALNDRNSTLFEGLEPRMRTMQIQLEEMNERGAAIEAVEPRMVSIQTQLEVLNDRGAVIEAVAPRIVAIQDQLDVLNERGSVLDVVGQRMEAIQSQLEALNERVAERPADPSVAQIEAQVRQLVARMDQTGAQIASLAKLYSESEDRDTSPDYEAIADLVANRTSQAIARDEPTAAFSDENLAHLEDRMANLLRSAAADNPPEDFSVVREGIHRVDERLERLESALKKLAEESASAEAAVAEPVFRIPEPLEPQVFSATTTPGKLPRRSDAMPESPTTERPLAASPFPDLGPVRAALEARTSRKKSAALDERPAEVSGSVGLVVGGAGAASSEPLPVIEPVDFAELVRPAVDPTGLQLPKSEPIVPLAESDIFGSSAVKAAESAGTADASVSATSSRNTFIEAARRAAQRQTPMRADSDPTSLIGRALARFQVANPGDRKADDKAVAADTPVAEAMAVQAETSPKGKGRKSDVPLVAMPVGAAEATSGSAGAMDVPAAGLVAANEDAPAESFLSRHRKPILLAASVVALSFLTLNLISQRMSAEDPAALPLTETAAPEAPEQPVAVQVPTVNPAPASATMTSANEAAPMVDTLATGSIDNAAAQQGFVPTDAMPALPQEFQAVAADAGAPAEDSTPVDALVPAADLVAALPEVIESPVQVELPPESLGPIELRQAAADGDARAQFEIGAIYTEGRAVSQDFALAAAWYERAAAQGFAPAQYRLANLYENGRGVEQDLEQARLWYQRAAEAGNRMSMHNLAALYAGGELGRQEFASAAEWFEKAARQGMTDSQFNLGMLYARGLGVGQSMEESYRWFALAATSGDEDAAKARDDVAKSLDADAVSRVNAEIAAWTPEGINLAANFAPIGTWSATFDPGQPIETAEVVRGVQTLLNRLGYDVGVPDGLAGPMTAEAIRAFERATGMSESGTVNPRLLAVLGSQPV